MKKIFIILVFIFWLTVGLLLFLEVNFDKVFLINFLQGLLPNIIMLFVALFIVDYLVDRNKINRCKDINKMKSEHLLFLSNRVAFHILEYLGFAHLKEMKNAEITDFKWAIDRLRAKIKSNEIRDVYFKKLIASNDKTVFVEKFNNIIKKDCDVIIKELDMIYPHPKPKVKELLSNTYSHTGMLMALGLIAKAIKNSNTKVANVKEKISEEQEKMLLDIGYHNEYDSVISISKGIVKFSEEAEKNNLFILV